MAAPNEVAAWMMEQIETHGVLHQDDAVDTIERKFGAEFTTVNANGNAAIRRDVLKSFRDLTGETVIWERGERLWRRREAFDSPGRGQV